MIRTATGRWRAAILAAIVCAGCTAVRLPAAPPAEDLDALARAAGSLGTATAYDEYRTDAQALGAVLEETGLFSDVRVAYGDWPRPGTDWIVEGQVNLPLVEPMLTVLSIGVIPHVRSGVAERTLHLSTHADPQPAHSAIVRHDHTVVVGWLGLPLTLFPDWTLEGSEAHRARVGQLLGAELLRSLGPDPRPSPFVGGLPGAE